MCLQLPSVFQFAPAQCRVPMRCTTALQPSLTAAPTHVAIVYPAHLPIVYRGTYCGLSVQATASMLAVHRILDFVRSVQATASMLAVHRILDFIRSAAYINSRTATLDITLLAFNTHFRTFASYQLPLSQRPDGTFVGTGALLHCFETAYDLDTEQGRYRLIVDGVVAGLAVVHIALLVIQIVSVIRSNSRKGVRPPCLVLRFEFEA